MRAGLKFKDEREPVRVSDTVDAMLDIYFQARKEPLLTDVAWGLLVGGISIALNINLKTSKLVVEHALALRGVDDE
jgi:hypothetical protein